MIYLYALNISLYPKDDDDNADVSLVSFVGVGK
jgi:hypothetical protein